MVSRRALSSEREVFTRLHAEMTVEWSRPPKRLPICVNGASVSSRERYMATWRGTTIPLSRRLPFSAFNSTW